MKRRSGPLALALLLSATLAALVFSFVPLRMDMAGFLPAGRDDASRFLLHELQSGLGASIVLVGVENAPEAQLAQISRAMRAELVQKGDFSVVLNGQENDLRDVDLLKKYRYLLAPSAHTRDFSAQALSADFADVLDALESSAEPLAQEVALRDPTGALLDTLHAMEPAQHAQSRHGVWFAPERPRALMMLRIRQPGMDLNAQKHIRDEVEAAFQRAHPGDARLLLTGPAIFATESAQTMRHDIELISACSTMLVLAVLLWRFRSLWVLAAIFVPFLLSLSIAMLSVRLVFGWVHGIAFGFGMTMLGVSLDYPVLLIGHREAGEGPEIVLKRIGPSLRMAVLTATLGLTGMVFCGLPGLAQLGLFSAVGLLTAAGTTLWLMPRLVSSADLAPAVGGASLRLLRWEAWRDRRGWCALPVLLAATMLFLHPPSLERSAASLNPVPHSRFAMDQELRHELGAPETGYVMVVKGTDPENVLRHEEALLPKLEQLRQSGAIGPVQAAASWLPSAALQQARMEALPSLAELRSAIAQAQKGLPFRAEAFDPFIADVAASQALSPLRLENLANTALGLRLQTVLFMREGAWCGLILPENIHDPAALSRTFTQEPGVMVLDLHNAVSHITARHTLLALRWMAVGIGLAVLLLAVGLRDARRLGRVLRAVAAVGVVLLAILMGRSGGISVVHVVALQFVLGVALDYALFFARPQVDAAERTRTLRTLLTCNTMTVLTFGLLATCHTPLLRDIGFTVATGAFLALIFSFMLSGPRTKLPL
ncbi:MMPL family transporter [Kozakia baliensis]|uniref:MMPL family transporter n=1 Tax=Kozakia baliensis TaxID=153496 RepID=UPI00345C2312